jgi:hypothetical protein
LILEKPEFNLKYCGGVNRQRSISMHFGGFG